MKMTFAKRLKLAMDYAGFRTNKQLAESVRKLPAGGKFSQQAAKRLLSGKDKRTEYIVHIAVACGINPTWLAMEEEPMAEIEITSQGLNACLMFESLSDEDQIYIKGIMDAIKTPPPATPATER